MSEELNNEKPHRGPKVEKVTIEKITYTVEYVLTKSDSEIDLDFDLANPVEDRLFAYAVVLADLMNVLEKTNMRHSPEGFVAELQNTIKMLKSSLDANQLVVEKKHGVINERHKILEQIGLKKQNEQENIINELKEKLQKELNLNTDIVTQSIVVSPENISSDEKLEELAKKVLANIPDNIDIGSANFALGSDLPHEIKEKFEKILRKLLEEKKKAHEQNDNDEDIEI